MTSGISKLPTGACRKIAAFAGNEIAHRASCARDHGPDMSAHTFYELMIQRINAKGLPIPDMVAGCVPQTWNSKTARFSWLTSLGILLSITPRRNLPTWSIKQTASLRQQERAALRWLVTADTSFTVLGIERRAFYAAQGVSESVNHVSGIKCQPCVRSTPVNIGRGERI